MDPADVHDPEDTDDEVPAKHAETPTPDDAATCTPTVKPDRKRLCLKQLWVNTFCSVLFPN